MKANRKFVEGEEAVSAVIGVILMVAITVAIAATVYVYVSGIIGPGTGSTPTLSMNAATSGTSCSVTVATVSEPGILWADCNVTVHNITAAAVHPYGQITLPADTTVSGGDLIAVAGLYDAAEYRCTIVYESTPKELEKNEEVKNTYLGVSK